MIDSLEIEDRIAKCDKILRDNPQSQIFAALADAHRKKGDYQKAQDICSQGLKQHPDYASARIVMAKILTARGAYELAQEELKRATLLTGRTRAIDTIDAEILIRSGQKSEAAILIDGLSSTDPDDENIKILKELLEHQDSTSSVAKAEVARAEAVASALISSPAEKKGRRELTLSHAVSILKVMPRVLGVMAVGPDGLLLNSRFDGIQSKEEFAALTKGIYDAALAGSSKTRLGDVHEVLLEMPSSKIWISARDKYTLVVLTRDDVSMGALKMKIEELFQNVVYGGSEAVLK